MSIGQTFLFVGLETGLEFTTAKDNLELLLILLPLPPESCDYSHGLPDLVNLF